MFINNTEYDRVNARNVELAKQLQTVEKRLQTIDDILLDAEANKTPAVYIVDKIKEVIRPQKQNNF